MFDNNNQAKSYQENLMPVDNADLENTPFSPGPKVHISVFKCLTDTAVVRGRDVSWQELATEFTARRVITDRKEKAPLYNLARFIPGGACCADNVEELTGLVMDIDGTMLVEQVEATLRGYEYVIYSTHGYTSNRPKTRVVMPLTRPIPKAEWLRFWAAANAWMGGGLDAATKDVSRRYWFPSCPAERKDIAFSFHRQGKILDPNELLSAPAQHALPVNSLGANILNGLHKRKPDMTKGYPDNFRTDELMYRVGWCLGPGKMTEEEAVKACLEWNQRNTPPLSERKVIDAVRSIAKKEAQKSAQESPTEQASPQLPPDVDVLVTELVALSVYEYELRRKNEADRIGIRVAVLDDLVNKRRPPAPEEDGSKGGKPLSLPTPEPWPDTVNGAELLDQIAAEFRRFVILPDGAAEAMALWALHTHVFEASPITPRLILSSPVMRCGKSTALRIMAALVPKCLMAANITPAATFRTIEKARPTLLIDEADSFLKDNEGMRGIINSGHAKDGTVIRTSGDDHDPRVFSAWCPLLLAAIGKLAGTIEDRAIMIPMRRRKHGESIARMKPKEAERLAVLCRKAARWAADHLQSLIDADPDISEELNDRATDNWRPLIAIADKAGGIWPGRARQVALILSDEAVQEDQSVSIQLLSDIRDILRTTKTDKIASGDLCLRLEMLEGKPWAEWFRGKAMTQVQLARQLTAYKIKSKDIRFSDTKVAKGYEFKQFEDAFSRYLPCLPPQQPLHI